MGSVKSDEPSPGRLDRVRSALQKPEVLWRGALTAIGSVAMVTLLFTIVAPMFDDWSLYGHHDWDVVTAYRYITSLSLLKYGEAPFWHPWLCGGFPAYGHVEGATNFVSPYLPVYLLMDVQKALRIEIVGSALTSLLGSFLLASRYTRSIALPTFVAILYTLNGRWALQAVVGHAWHLQYCWLPWILLFFERSLEEKRLHNALYAGVGLGLMCHMGAIYPLPHAAIILCVYGLAHAVLSRSWRPVAAVAIAGFSGLGFAAPKLFAVAEGMTRAPRLIGSTEKIGLDQFVVMLTDHSQGLLSRPIPVPAYGWHEWGMYVGVVPLLLLVVALLAAPGIKGNAFRITGGILLLLGFGAFHTYSPWSLLHRLPVFSSQHVPSRFLYPAVLLLGLALVVLLARYLDRHLVRRAWLDVPLMAVVILIGVDIAKISNQPFHGGFWMELPDKYEVAEVFEHHRRSSINYKRKDWAEPVLLGMFTNTGVIKCYGLPNLETGAIGVKNPNYKGRAYVLDSDAKAKVVEWSPNRTLIEVTGGKPGDTVIYNMNYDWGWSANGEPAIEHERLLAAKLGEGNTVEFTYFPRTFRYSLPLFFLTVGLSIGVPLAWKRRRERGQTGAPSSTAEAPP